MSGVIFLTHTVEQCSCTECIIAVDRFNAVYTSVLKRRAYYNVSCIDWSLSAHGRPFQNSGRQATKAFINF